MRVDILQLLQFVTIWESEVNFSRPQARGSKDHVEGPMLNWDELLVPSQDVSDGFSNPNLPKQIVC